MRSIRNPPNPWQSTSVEYLGEPPPAALAVFEESARTALSRNDSPDLPFRWSLNPYRGCHHACAYCYARPTHQYLDWGAGTDFERNIVVKLDVDRRLREAFLAPSWRGERIAFSGVTDCYQPLEASYELTRRCLEVCREFRNPVVIVTKGALVRRDVDLLADLARCASLRVYLSVPFATDRGARALEPDASPVSARLAAITALTEAGIETGVAIAPLILGLNDEDVAPVLAAARDAGARHAFLVALRLPAEVRPVFVERLREALPGRAEAVLSAVRASRDGRWNEAAFGARQRGRGPRWHAVERVFEVQCRRLGLATEREPQGPTTFRRPGTTGSLFEP